MLYGQDAEKKVAGGSAAGRTKIAGSDPAADEILGRLMETRISWGNSSRLSGAEKFHAGLTTIGEVLKMAPAEEKEKKKEPARA